MIKRNDLVSDLSRFIQKRFSFAAAPAAAAAEDCANMGIKGTDNSIPLFDSVAAHKGLG